MTDKKTFFTSDHHFGHANIIKFCNRPFENVDDMNQELIRRWNEKIGKDDEVYHLGDFGLTNKTALSTILDQLNGTIYLIVGNHEGAALENRHKAQRHRYSIKQKRLSDQCREPFL